MSSWRDQVLREFTPQVARLTLVADPDGLLLDEVIIQGISERGFDLIEFDDHVRFRFAYESKYRAAWDRGEATDLVVVLRSGFSDLASLPYDLLQAGRRLAFSLGDLFPNLCTWVVAALDRGELEKLWSAQTQYAPGVLGENATKDFVLRHVFEIAPELIANPSDLLRVLLRRHYRAIDVPALFDDRLVALLAHSGRFQGWPLDRIFHDRSAFFRFLQERWPAFVDRVVRSGGEAAEPGAAFDLEFGGPTDLPFDHDDVRIYVDDLFAEGLLLPIEHDRVAQLASHWAVVGVVTDPLRTAEQRLKTLLVAVRGSLPEPDARHHEWLAYAQRWAQLRLLQFEAPFEAVASRRDEIDELSDLVESRFLAWVLDRYSGLHSQPARPPVMVHHLPRALAFERETVGTKIALVVIDGLALDQWLSLRSALLEREPGWVFSEGTVFAWLPTLTSVSRQALFAGRPPLYFPRSLFSTDKEPQLWAQFWADQGVGARNVAYMKALGDAGSLDRVREAVAQPSLKVLGLVVDTVDHIMHGMELGSRGMHGQIRQWAEEGFLSDLCSFLLGSGFQVHLTSDHGNIEATGCGRPSEGSLADVRGERARVYPNKALRDRTAAAFPNAIAWPGVGLPDGFDVLLAPPAQAFVPVADRIVAHGGISIEELIVPWVRVERPAR